MSEDIKQNIVGLEPLPDVQSTLTTDLKGYFSVQNSMRYSSYCAPFLSAYPKYCTCQQSSHSVPRSLGPGDGSYTSEETWPSVHGASLHIEQKHGDG